MDFVCSENGKKTYKEDIVKSQQNRLKLESSLRNTYKYIYYY